MRRSSLATLAALVGLLALGAGALGCGGATTSLDIDESTAASTSVATQGTTGAAADASDEGETAALAPAICAAECTPLLALTWDYEGPSGHYAVVELLHDPSGGLWLGTQRSGGAVGLVHLSSEGELEWAANLGLPCSRCELADIALHPSRDVMLSATARGSLEPAQTVIARIDTSTREVAWVRTLALSPGVNMRARAGELAVIEDDRIALFRVNGFSEGEVVEVLDFTGDGTLRAQGPVRIQPGSGDAWPPLAASSPTGEIVLAHMSWNDQTERMTTATTRLVPSHQIISRLELLQPLDDLVVDEQGRRIELARSRGTETVTLAITSRRSSDLERWRASLPLLSTSSTRAALAVGPDQAVYVAARTTPAADPGRTYEVTLEVARWTVDGMLRWQAARPLEMMATPDPLELLIDEDHGVIVATVVGGRPYVARYEQACACE